MYIGPDRSRLTMPSGLTLNILFNRRAPTFQLHVKSSPLADQILFHLTIIAVLILRIQSLKCSMMNSGWPVVVNLGAISSLSLPQTPTCLGIRQYRPSHYLDTYIPWEHILKTIYKLVYNFIIITLKYIAL